MKNIFTIILLLCFTQITFGVRAHPFEERAITGLYAEQVCSCVCGRAEIHNLKLVENCARTYGGEQCRLKRGVDSTYNVTTCKKIYVIK